MNLTALNQSVPGQRIADNALRRDDELSRLVGKEDCRMERPVLVVDLDGEFPCLRACETAATRQGDNVASSNLKVAFTVDRDVERLSGFFNRSGVHHAAGMASRETADTRCRDRNRLQAFEARCRRV